MEHCTQLKFEHPDKIAPGITEWIEANSMLDKISTVIPMTTAEAAGALTSPNGQPQAKYVFNFFVFWTSKSLENVTEKN